ncbi:signal peptide peptidase SppA [Halodesulfovibrio marinisediminis]|uniref:Signal peptide peptidase A. Serine peptidase. MEROPS family S49 n=1 Tax=Halodesulfovibrio marinisediminis DSM 17456 TaxID=1121457 RepID=A0A1N6GP13_9BACT|nr:signal peptide peptidase SppA [Halodesulfovibrio marinisediminis]SIO09221.1 signal peptide peptidase A. Serine peptidase. MEROPS family S49 [Halodesulfovibrio marinisediminis DSM 17456]
MQANKPNFSQKHPLLFGIMLIIAAVALFAGATAALRVSKGNSMPYFTQDKFGVINVEGFIGDSRKVSEWAYKLRNNDSIKGVIVRINSPGGGVAASQEMYYAIKRLAEVKPVVISMGTVAASGGYYIAAAGHKIVANPATLTGSIGVKMELPNFKGLMQKIGVSYLSLTSGKLKAAGSPFQTMTPEEREYFQAIIMDMYNQFIDVIVEGRHMKREQILPYADGRVMTGQQALAAGFVDILGDRETAYMELTKLCKLDAPLPLEEGPKKEQNFLKDLLTSVLDLAPVNTVREQNSIQLLYN